MGKYNVGAFLKAESFKIKYNKGMIMLFVFPVVITMIISIYLINKSGDIPEPVSFNPWVGFLGRYLFPFYSLFFPIMIAVSCYSLCETEYKNKSFRQLFTLPVPKRNIFLSKVIFLTGMIFKAVVISFAIFLLSGHLVNYISPVYNFPGNPVIGIAAAFFLKIFIAGLSIVLIQYFLGLIFENFIIPVGIASFVTIFSMIAYKWKYIDYIPYNSFSSASRSFMKADATLFNNAEYINIAYILIFSLLSYWAFVRKKT